MSENYLGIMMRIMSGNYDLVYSITWKRFIGILAYPKTLILGILSSPKLNKYMLY